MEQLLREVKVKINIKIIVDLDAFWETIKKVNEPDTYPLQYCGVRWSKNAD